jgi:mycoredoxin-dependent peroxiredoxin
MPGEVGERAPDFELKDQHNQLVRLSSFRGGRNVVLVFYPFAFTGVCSGELSEIQDRLGSFQNDEVQVLTVSTDSVYAQRVFADQEKFDYPMLSDFWPHGAVAQAYGILDNKRGCALRGTFIIDKQGMIRWKVVHGLPDARNVAEYQQVLAEL